MTYACEHGFPKPANCWACMEDGNIEPAPRVTVERSGIYARFDGHCEECNLGIHVGQSLSCLSDGSYVHVGCEP